MKKPKKTKAQEIIEALNKTGKYQDNSALQAFGKHIIFGSSFRDRPKEQKQCQK